MRSSGQTRADLMALRALISNGVSTVTGKIDALESSLAPVATSGSYSDLSDTPTLSAVATSGAYADLTGKPTLGALASQDSVTHLQVSDWSSATSSFLTEHQSLAAYAKKADLGDLASLDTIPHGKISDWASATSSFLTSHQDISGLLAKSGGTMSGSIVVSGNWANGFLKQASDSSYTSIMGGTAAANGAYISVSGKDRSQYAGYFRIVAQNGNNSSLLEGRPDGTLTWDGEKIAVASDLAAKQDLLAVEEIPLTFPAEPEAAGFVYRDITCHRFGKVVVLSIHVQLANALADTTTIATGLPPPVREIRQVLNTWASTFRRPVRARISANGELTFRYGYAIAYSHTWVYLAA